jgi:hypothetical protein
LSLKLWIIVGVVLGAILVFALWNVMDADFVPAVPEQTEEVDAEIEGTQADESAVDQGAEAVEEGPEDQPGSPEGIDEEVGEEFVPVDRGGNPL